MSQSCKKNSLNNYLIQTGYRSLPGKCPTQIKHPGSQFHGMNVESPFPDKHPGIPFEMEMPRICIYILLALSLDLLRFNCQESSFLQTFCAKLDCFRCPLWCALCIVIIIIMHHISLIKGPGVFLLIVFFDPVLNRDRHLIKSIRIFTC